MTWLQISNWWFRQAQSPLRTNFMQGTAKQKFLYILKIAVLIVVFEVFNLLLSYANSKIRFMLFLDTIFSVALTFYAGLLPGLIIALIHNPLCGIMFSKLYGTPIFFYGFLYSICGMLIVLVTWLFSRKKEYLSYSMSMTILYLFMIAFASAFASCISTAFLDTFIKPLSEKFQLAKVDDFADRFDVFSSILKSLNFGTFFSYFLPRIPLTIIDRIACTFLGFFVYKALLFMDNKK